MKKVFSLLLVVAMLVSLSVVASAAANANGGMHTVVTETDTDITVDVYIANAESVNGFTHYLLSDAVSFVAGSAEACGQFAGCDTFSETNKTGYNKYVVAWSAAEKAATFTAAEKVLTYKVAKIDATAELSAADFSYSTSTIKVSKVNTINGGTVAGQTGGNSFTTKSQPAYFTIDYVDDRTPIVENPFSATASGTTITCIGKVDASATNYGVVFTAASTLDGARAQKFYGAMDGDTVSDGAEGTRTFTFGDWDGSFQIILEGVHAGEKELDFFVNDTVIEDTNFTLTVE